MTKRPQEITFLEGSRITVMPGGTLVATLARHCRIESPGQADLHVGDGSGVAVLPHRPPYAAMIFLTIAHDDGTMPVEDRLPKGIGVHDAFDDALRWFWVEGLLTQGRHVLTDRGRAWAAALAAYPLPGVSA